MLFETAVKKVKARLQRHYDLSAKEADDLVGEHCELIENSRDGSTPGEIAEEIADEAGFEDDDDEEEEEEDDDEEEEEEDDDD